MQNFYIYKHAAYYLNLPAHLVDNDVKTFKHEIHSYLKEITINDSMD